MFTPADDARLAQLVAENMERQQEIEALREAKIINDAAEQAQPSLDAFYSSTHKIAGVDVAAKDLLAVHQQVQHALQAAAWPQMVRVTNADDQPALYCPRCAEIVDGADEVDFDERRNGGTREDNDVLSISVGDSNYQTLYYACPSCYEPVSLPDGMESAWS